MLLKIIPALLIVGESYDLRSSDTCATLERVLEHSRKEKTIAANNPVNSNKLRVVPGVIIPLFKRDRPSLDETGRFD